MGISLRFGEDAATVRFTYPEPLNANVMIPIDCSGFPTRRPPSIAFCAREAAADCQANPADRESQAKVVR